MISWFRRALVLALLVTASPLVAAEPALASAPVTGSVNVQGDSVASRFYWLFVERLDGTQAKAVTITSSTFSIGDLPDGQYRVKVSLIVMDGLVRYLVADDVHGSATADGATIVTVGGADAPPALVLDIPPIARVGGHVTDAAGGPLGHLPVHWSKSGQSPGYGATTYSDGAGRFDLGYIQAGDIVVESEGIGDVAGERRVVTVPESGQVAVDLTLADPAAHLTGIVTDADTGKPLSDIWVTAGDPDGPNLATVVTDDTGRYRIDGLPEGEVLVRFDDVLTGRQTYPRTYSPGTTDGEQSVPVTVMAGETTTYDQALTSLPGSPPEPHTLSGVVSAPSGLPLAGISVVVRSLTSAVQVSVTTDYSGSWSAQVPDGVYLLGFRAGPYWHPVRNEPGPWLPLYLPGTLTADGAQSVTVTDQVPVDGLDITLPDDALLPLSAVAGTDPLETVGVQLFDPVTGDLAYSAPVGSEHLAVPLELPTGTWKILVLGDSRAPALLPQWLGGGTTFASAPTITLAAGANPAMSVTLPTSLAPERAPRVIGRPRAGATLRATHGQWNLMTGTSFTYRWRRGGEVIGVEPTHAVRRADLGHRLTARVTATNGALETTFLVRVKVAP